METMIGIAALLVGAGVLWVCFAFGVYLFTRTGREGLRIQRMEDERRPRVPPEQRLGGVRGSPANRVTAYTGPARGVSSAGRAPALQAGGHRFDPGTLHSSTTPFLLT